MTRHTGRYRSNIASTLVPSDSRQLAGDQLSERTRGFLDQRKLELERGEIALDRSFARAELRQLLTA